MHAVECHRNRRGPYTGAGELVRSIARTADAAGRALVERHALTLLSVAPEIERHVRVPESIARSFTFSREGNSRFWTLRLAHGLTEFLLEYFGGRGGSPVTLSFEEVHDADALDREFLAVLLGRADAAVLRVVIGTSTTDLPQPLRAALHARARLGVLPPVTGVSADAPSEPATSFADERLHAKRYVESECTAEDAVARTAYAKCSVEVRRELHRARAVLLEVAGEPSLALGAIPLHHERAGSGVAPLLAASTYCMRMAYYESSLDCARRGLALLESGASGGKEHSELSRNALFSLLLLDRLAEVETYCDEIAASSNDPALRSHAAYALAILHARAYPEERRDYAKARAYVEEALAFAERVDESETRTVNLVFLRNTLALVEMRVGRPERSLELLTEGLERLAREAPSRCDRESIILLQNRARLHVLRGDLPAAIQDYTTLLEREPSNSEAHLDRGILRQRLGRLTEALEDYDLSIAWSPPYDEVRFNRAQVLTALGRKAEAIEAYGAVLALEPEHRAALVNRAGLLFERGNTSEARRDVDRALRAGARDAKAWCLSGLLDMAEGRLDSAHEALTRAVECDDREETAFINRATVLWRKGDAESALRDLDRALSIRETATARGNRARILHALAARGE